MTITKLSIDLKYKDYKEVEAFYKAICNLNKNSEFGIEIMDDGNAPYTEDITEQYKELGVKDV